VHSITTRLETSLIGFSRKALAAVLSFGMIALSACGGNGTSVPPQSGSNGNTSVLSQITFPVALSRGYVTTTCQAPTPGHVTCANYALTALGRQAMGLKVLETSQRKPLAMCCGIVLGGASIGAAGYTPQDILAAYGLTSASATGGVGRTVALVDVGDNPYTEADLGVFTAAYGLKACTIANNCLRVIAQDGSANLPAAYPAWYNETSEDVETVVAICPNCNVVVVEANSTAMSDIAVAENTAAKIPGVIAIDNSFTASEDASMTQYASAFNHPGIAITAATGDYPSVPIPASYSTVIAVGGTELTQDSSTARGWSETAVGVFGNSACSAIVPKPAWQFDTGCAKRMTSDISFDAGLDSSFAEYGHILQAGTVYSGWGWVGGATSFASAAMAAIYALVGAPVNDASSLYYGASGLYDITVGALPGIPDGQGGCIPPPAGSGAVSKADNQRHAQSIPGDLPAYFCTALPGFDGPTGNGTPHGLSAFTATICTLPPVSSPNPHPTQNPKAPPGGCTS
jgi:subtilase family serine protease